MFLAQAEPSTPLWALIIMPLLPWAVLFVFVWLIVRWQSKIITRQSREQTAALEAKLDRVIKVIEQRKGGV
ncbi:MAG TPA: hypothetical protein VF595_12770 [Tepidisphaeraceae bacterium]|jgi:ATP-dependent Zn protease